MPTDDLPLRVEHFLLRACPTAVLATHDIVAEAVRRSLRDEDVISQLAREYNCDRMGYPMGPMPNDTPVGVRGVGGDGIHATSRGGGGGLGGYTNGGGSVHFNATTIPAAAMGGNSFMPPPADYPTSTSRSVNGYTPLEIAVGRRRRLLINYYIVNKIFPIDLKKIEVLCDAVSADGGLEGDGATGGGGAQRSTFAALTGCRLGLSDGTLLAGLKLKYGRTEVGYPCPRAAEAAVGGCNDGATEPIGGNGANNNTDSTTLVPNTDNTDASPSPRRTSTAPSAAADATADDKPSTKSRRSKSKGSATSPSTRTGTPIPSASQPTVAQPQPPREQQTSNQTEDTMGLRHEVELIFLRAAPERMAEAKGVCDSYERFAGLATREEVLRSVRRSLGGCASDGWPMNPDKRRLARLQRYLKHNDPTRLKERTSEITEMVNSEQSDHALFLELYYSYGKDELGRDVDLDNYLHDEVSMLLSRCRPVSATEEFVCTYLALGQRKGWDGDRLLNFLRDHFDCDRDGWPLEVRQRIRSRTLRYLMLNAPQDVANVDAVLTELVGGATLPSGASASLSAWAGEGLNEGHVMTLLYERYGRNEEGKEIINTPAIRFKVCAFLEQYVPESEVERLADAAMNLRMHPDALMHYLKHHYSSFTPYPYELRWQLYTMYRRAAPSKLHQVDQLLKVKRVEKIPDATLIKAVCRKLNCGPDGWPADPMQRRRKRLQQFFEKHDPQRLVQVELLVSKDARSEEQLMADLAKQYRVPLTDDHDGGANTSTHTQTIVVDDSNGASFRTANGDGYESSLYSVPTAARPATPAGANQGQQGGAGSSGAMTRHATATSDVLKHHLRNGATTPIHSYAAAPTNEGTPLQSGTASSRKLGALAVVCVGGSDEDITSIDGRAGGAAAAAATNASVNALSPIQRHSSFVDANALATSLSDRTSAKPATALTNPNASNVYTITPPSRNNAQPTPTRHQQLQQRWDAYDQRNYSVMSPDRTVFATSTVMNRSGANGAYSMADSSRQGPPLTMSGAQRTDVSRTAVGLGFSKEQLMSSEGATFEANRHKYRWMGGGGVY